LIWVEIGKIVGWVVWFLLGYVILMAEWFGSLSWASVEVPAIHWSVAVGMYGIILLWYYRSSKFKVSAQGGSASG
jgi:hypothetical protein